MEMKATHKLVATTCDEWLLKCTGHSHYWNKIPGKWSGEGWQGPGGKSVDEDYSGDKSFILIKLPTFKGNK